VSLDGIMEVVEVELLTLECALKIHMPPSLPYPVPDSQHHMHSAGKGPTGGSGHWQRARPELGVAFLHSTP
jgi:hypothetical protein